MNYVKIIRIMGSIYAREFEKDDKGKKNFKYREVDEKTVAENFKKNGSTVEIIFEDTDRESIVISAYSDKETIKSYLGQKFL